MADYANVDSLVAGNLVFHGATDRFEYALADSVHSRYWVVNHSSKPETLLAKLQCSPSIRFSEQSCQVINDSLTVCEETAQIVGGCRSSLQPVVLQPGSTLIEERVFLPEPPRNDWTGDFFAGRAFFHRWTTEPKIFFYVSYIRRIPTAVRNHSWSTLKSLYR